MKILLQSILSQPGPGGTLPRPCLLPARVQDTSRPFFWHRLEYPVGHTFSPFVTIVEESWDKAGPFRFRKNGDGVDVYYRAANPWWPELHQGLPFLHLKRGRIARLEHTYTGMRPQPGLWTQVDLLVCTDRPRRDLFLMPPSVYRVSLETTRPTFPISRLLTKAPGSVGPGLRRHRI